MNDSDIKIVFCSDFRYEKLIIEMYYCDKYIALLNQDHGKENVIIEFPRSKFDEDSISRIDLATFEKALELAKREIMD